MGGVLVGNIGNPHRKIHQTKKENCNKSNPSQTSATRKIVRANYQLFDIAKSQALTKSKNPLHIMGGM